MPRYLTNSEMSTWRRCKRKWWLSHYRKLHRAGAHEFNKPLGIGNRVHDTLAFYYAPARADIEPIGVMEFFEATVKKDLDAHPELEVDIEKEADMCRIMLEGYFEWLAETGEDQAMTVIETERARIARLEPERDVFLLTKLDARVRHDEYGSRLALEHKTVSSLKQHLPELQMNSQCLTEHLAEFLALIEEGADDAEAESAQGVLFNMLRKCKRTARANGPFYARTPVRHTKEQLRNHWRHVAAIADQIETATRRLDAGEDHQLVVDPSPMETCHWQCEFFHCCPMFDTGDDAEGYLRAKFEEGDPLARYRGLLPDG